MKRKSAVPLIVWLILIQSILLAQNVSWRNVDEILTQITPPSFPDKEYNIKDFGAVGDGRYNCTEAFKKAIDQCSSDGGGKVVVPEGVYFTGSIHLRNNVNLYVSEKAVVKFSTDENDYLPAVFTRWEGVECMNYSSLIYAYGKENIAVTGKGILDGQGSTHESGWWNWKGNKESGWKKGKPDQKAGRKKLFEMGENSIPPEQRIMGKGYYLRPNFIQLYRCRNILIEGVTLKNSPMWFIHPVLSENISVLNATVEGLGPNNDGCNPESSKNVLIKNCFFNTGDDCIAIKSGRNNDGRRLSTPSENILIQGCTMKEGHGGVVIGSEISGGVRNVFASDCQMNSPNLDRALRIKTNAVRGGIIENIFMRNVQIGEVREAVLLIDFFYEEADKGHFRPIVRNINMDNVTSEKSKYAIWIKAFKDSPVEKVCINNCEFNNVAESNILENVDSIELNCVKINGKNFVLNNN